MPRARKVKVSRRIDFESAMSTRERFNIPRERKLPSFSMTANKRLLWFVRNQLCLLLCIHPVTCLGGRSLVQYSKRVRSRCICDIIVIMYE